MENLEAFLEKFKKIGIFARGGKRAPHKPLLLLYALARFQQKRDKYITFTEAEKDVEPLINLYRPWSKTPSSVSYPFGRLANDSQDIWKVDSLPNMVDKSGNIRVSSARSVDLKAGFTDDVLAVLEKHPHVIENVAGYLLSHHFAPSLHEEILDAVGLEVGGGTAKTDDLVSVERRKRNPEFRREVMDAYFEQCCFCGFDMKIKGSGNALALEAAHIQWHAAHGPDAVVNGLALCALHHRLFDFGALTVTTEHTIYVSEQIVGDWARKLTEEFQTKRIREPRKAEYAPAKEYLQWHHTQVFKGDLEENYV